MALHNPDIIAEPFGNLIDRHSTARQERCKGVTHDMWRHPRRSLSGCVFRKRPAEIVPVKTFPPSRNLGMEHERLSQAILPQELSKFLGHGDTALLAIFEGHRGGLTKMKNSVFYIEPEGSRFDDLIKAKARVKTAVKHEFQVFTGAFSNKPISKFRGTEVLSCRRRGRLDLDRRRGIFPARPLDLNTPTKESPQGHQVSMSSSDATRNGTFPIIALHQYRCHILWCDTSRPSGKRPQNVSFAIRACQRPLAALPAVIYITIHRMNQNSARLKHGFFPNLARFLDCFGRIRGLQTDPVTFFLNLTGKPITTPSAIDATGEFINWLCHPKNCHTLLSHFQVKHGRI